MPVLASYATCERCQQSFPAVVLNMHHCTGSGRRTCRECGVLYYVSEEKSHKARKAHRAVVLDRKYRKEGLLRVDHTKLPYYARSAIERAIRDRVIGTGGYAHRKLYTDHYVARWIVEYAEYLHESGIASSLWGDFVQVLRDGAHMGYVIPTAEIKELLFIRRLNKQQKGNPS